MRKRSPTDECLGSIHCLIEIHSAEQNVEKEFFEETNAELGLIATDDEITMK